MDDVLPKLPKLNISKKMWKYLRISLRQAQSSPHRHFKHGSVVVRGGAIMSQGHNHHSIHAEVSAMNKSSPEMLKGSTVWSVRLTHAGTNIAEAKPCPRCQKALKACGVREVYYSTSQRTIELMIL